MHWRKHLARVQGLEPSQPNLGNLSESYSFSTLTQHAGASSWIELFLFLGNFALIATSPHTDSPSKLVEGTA